MLVNEQISFHSRLCNRQGAEGKVGRGISVGLRKSGRGSNFPSGHTYPLASCRRSQQVSHANQIVGGRRPDPSHSFQASEACLTHQGHSLEPTEDFFYPLAWLRQSSNCFVVLVA